MINKFRVFILFSIATSLWNCQSNGRYYFDFSCEIDYAHKVTVYSQAHKIKDIFSYEFYDKQNNLIELIRFENREKFIYDSIGNLQEKFICRMYNCEIGFRQIFIRDDFGNIIGYYNTTESILDIDTIQFKQAKFYNEENQLIKELTNSGNSFDGEHFEYWKYYVYDNNHILSDIEMRNNDTIWTGQYLYNDNGNLISIIYTNKKESVKKKKFEYNQFGKLIKESVENDKHLLEKKVSFSVDNNTTVYMYDDRERLVEKIIYNHKGEIYNKFVYEYEDKLQLTIKGLNATKRSGVAF